MRTLALSTWFMVIAFGVSAQVSPEALAACQAQETSFTKIEGCLPAAQVTVEILNAMTDLYGEAGTFVVDHCRARNADNFSGAGVCARNAVKSAVNLGAMLPEGATLDDPVFNALKDPAKQDELETVRTNAQAAFPDVMLWGGGTYFPYDP